MAADECGNEHKTNQISLTATTTKKNNHVRFGFD